MPAGAELFDKLQLRSALAETFSSIGIEGQSTWRQAAKVRVLLAWTGQGTVSLGSKEFWSDADVRWLAGVNESSGHTYVNKELFEELIQWLQLPVRLKDAEAAHLAITEAFAAARTAGYDIDKLQENLAGDKKVEASAVIADTEPEPADALRI